MNNKIKYGIKNAHAAIATIHDDNSAIYGIPFAIPGAVSLSLDPQGENTPFYADNIAYWIGTSNAGYEGDLEVAILPDEFHRQILAAATDLNGVLLEDADIEAVHFAFMFQIEGDKKATRHVLYNCTCTRPSVGGETKEDTVEPQTETTTITATTAYFPGVDKNIVKGKTTEETDETAYKNWFTSVYIPEGIAQKMSLSVDANITGDILGKTAADLQSDIQIVGSRIDGTLKYITGWTEAYTEDEADGNFLALHAAASAAGATITAELIGGIHGPVTLDADGILVSRITSTSQSIKFTASKEGYESKSVIYTLRNLTLLDS